MNSWNREAAVAGTFYPSDPDTLLEVLGGLLPDAEVERDVKAVIAPHAGYVYSGRIAGAVYSRVKVPSTVVILCPNHTGLGKRVALWSRGSWETPLGPVSVDSDFAEALLAEPGFEENRDAHFAEHAVETHLPFLKARNPHAKIVPLVLGRLSWEDCLRLAEGLARVVEVRGALMVASTDMSHYLSAGEAREKDRLALDEVKALAPKRLYEVVRREAISMCGFIPTAVVMEAARRLGAAEAEVVAYGHSGEVLGNDDRVVAYAGATIV